MGTGIRDLAGSRLGGYEIVSLLGLGGMGVVYRARSGDRPDPVALKVVAEGPGDTGDPAGRGTGREAPPGVDPAGGEGRPPFGFSHPNLVRVLESGTADGYRYLAMELVDGQTLRDHLDACAPLPIPAAARLAREVACGLAYLHDRGVVHLDIKPGNVLLARTGDVKITDFGIAPPGTDSAMEQSQAILGTVCYLSPERVEGHAGGPETDMYALGLILYEMLVGSFPYTGRSLTDWTYQILNTVPALPSSLNAQIPPALDELTLKLLEKERQQRPDAAATFARLDAILSTWQEFSTSNPGHRADTLRIRTAGPSDTARTHKTALRWSRAISRLPGGPAGSRVLALLAAVLLALAVALLVR